MPLYEVEGLNKDTGRKRKPVTIRAKNETAARAAARRKHLIKPEHVRLITIRHYETQVAGGSHKNDDGTSRQEIISACSSGEFLWMEHEQGNKYDKHATRIIRANGQQLGYVPAHIAEEIYEAFYKDDGCKQIVVAAEKVPYGSEDSRCHLNILILVALSTTPDSDIEAYLTNLADQVPIGICDNLKPYQSVMPPIVKKQAPIKKYEEQAPTQGCLFTLLCLMCCVALLSFKLFSETFVY
ncbi:MAG: HIRAN domain-containing protein [Planctomycetaceae bacterium]|nr:HIRAN domain-containing protein [Planctomycetaceae bacterium]